MALLGNLVCQLGRSDISARLGTTSRALPPSDGQAATESSQGEQEVEVKAPNPPPTAGPFDSILDDGHEMHEEEDSDPLDGYLVPEVPPLTPWQGH